MNHPILNGEQLEEWNKLFYDHLSLGGYTPANKELVHKTKNKNVVIGTPLKHPDQEIYRGIVLRDKYDITSIFEDPPMPIIEGVHYVECLAQLGSYVIEKRGILFEVMYWTGCEKFHIKEAVLKQEKHSSVELGYGNEKRIKNMIIGKSHALIYQDRKIIGGGFMNYAIKLYSQECVEKDLSSGVEYKVLRAKRFLGKQL